MKKAINIFKTKQGYVLHVFVETPLEIGIVVWDDEKIAKNLKDVQRIVKDALKEQYLGIESEYNWGGNKRDENDLIITLFTDSENNEVSFSFHYTRGTDRITEYLPAMKKHEVMFALDEILARKEYRVYV